MNKNFLLYCLCAVLMLTLAFYSSGQNRGNQSQQKQPSDTTYYVVIKMKTSDYIATQDTLGAVLYWVGKARLSDDRDNLIATAQRQQFRLNTHISIDTVIIKK